MPKGRTAVVAVTWHQLDVCSSIYDMNLDGTDGSGESSSQPMNRDRGRTRCSPSMWPPTVTA